MPISRRNRSAASERASVGVEDLDRDVTLVFQVAGEVDRRHAAGAELAVDLVTSVEGGGETGGETGVGVWHA